MRSLRRGTAGTRDRRAGPTVWGFVAAAIALAACSSAEEPSAGSFFGTGFGTSTGTASATVGADSTGVPPTTATSSPVVPPTTATTSAVPPPTTSAAPPATTLPPPAPLPDICGDGRISGKEVCDGATVAADCRSATKGDFPDGTLRCNATCDAFDTKGCSKCGNMELEGLEECDGEVKTTCKELGFAEGGEVTCDATCKIDKTGCCGDGKKGTNEDCEGTDFGGQTCVDFEYMAGQAFSGGALACNADCTANTNACVWCGDGTKNGEEDCEGTDLGGATCKSIGFISGVGTVSCGSDCAFDVSKCEGLRCGGENLPNPTGDTTKCPAACTGGCESTPEGPTCIVDCTPPNPSGVCGASGSGGSVSCPDNFNCRVDCRGQSACDRARITCPPTNGNCDVVCNGENSCWEVKLSCPPGRGDCAISCVGKDACQNADITCGAEGRCNLLCDGTGGDDPCYYTPTLRCGTNQCEAQCTNGGETVGVNYLGCETACNCEKGCPSI